MPNKLLQFSA